MLQRGVNFSVAGAFFRDATAEKRFSSAATDFALLGRVHLSPLYESFKSFYI
jgi:hypothetical protein